MGTGVYVVGEAGAGARLSDLVARQRPGSSWVSAALLASGVDFALAVGALMRCRTQVVLVADELDEELLGRALREGVGRVRPPGVAVRRRSCRRSGLVAAGHTFIPDGDDHPAQGPHRGRDDRRRPLPRGADPPGGRGAGTWWRPDCRTPRSPTNSALARGPCGRTWRASSTSCGRPTAPHAVGIAYELLGFIGPEAVTFVARAVTFVVPRRWPSSVLGVELRELRAGLFGGEWLLQVVDHGLKYGLMVAYGQG